MRQGGPSAVARRPPGLPHRVGARRVASADAERRGWIRRAERPARTRRDRRLSAGRCVGPEAAPDERLRLRRCLARIPTHAGRQGHSARADRLACRRQECGCRSTAWGISVRPRRPRKVGKIRRLRERSRRKIAHSRESPALAPRRASPSVHPVRRMKRLRATVLRITRSARPPTSGRRLPGRRR